MIKTRTYSIHTQTRIIFTNKYKEAYLGWVGGPLLYQQGSFKRNLQKEKFGHTHRFHELQFISLLQKQGYNQKSSRINSTT
jgi:hypothetical protein